MDHVVLFTLSKNGSLEFKRGIEDAENMVRNQSTNVHQLGAIHDRLYAQFELLEAQLDNPAYSEHQRGVMETYIEKLDHVIGLLQNRINEVMNSGEENNARGGRRKSIRRKSIRRRTGRRRKSIKKSVRRKSRRKSRRRKY